MRALLAYLATEKRIQQEKLDKAYRTYGDTEPYHEKVVEQRYRYFQVCDMHREVLEYITFGSSESSGIRRTNESV